MWTTLMNSNLYVEMITLPNNLLQNQVWIKGCKLYMVYARNEYCQFDSTWYISCERLSLQLLEPELIKSISLQTSVLSLSYCFFIFSFQKRGIKWNDSIMYTIPVWNVGIRIRYLFSSLDDAAFAQDNESAIDWPNRMIYHLLFSFCCFALVELSSLDPSHVKLIVWAYHFQVDYCFLTLTPIKLDTWTIYISLLY